jgi:hypothetical protein
MQRKGYLDVFTAPLTADEYRTLVEVKYHPGATSQIRGWALRDKDGRIRGWHPCGQAFEGRRNNHVHVRQLRRSGSPMPGGAMTVTLEITAAAFTASNSAASRPPRSGLTAHHVGKAFAVSAALVVAAAVMLLIILAVITLANDGLHANWSAT